MATGKITDRAIGSLQKEAKRTGKITMLWDTELKGFGASASPNGKVSWLFQHWVGGKDGKAKRTVFGHLANMDTEEARKRARKLRTDADDGIDILNRKQQRRQDQIARQQGAKLGETVARYLQLRHKPDKTKPTSYGMQVKGIFDKVTDTLGKDTLVASITKADVRNLLDAKQAAGQDGMARYLFAVLRPFFAWCLERDLIAISPVADLSAPAPLQARDRVLTDDEVKAFWKATFRIANGEHPIQDRKLPIPPSPIFAPFFRLLLLTAQRREEVAGMRWTEIDLERATWTIPRERTKNGKEHTLHLSPQALAVLATMDHIEGVSFVFSTTGDSSISGYTKSKARLDAFMQDALEDTPLEPWRVHDLRRTAASGMAMLGFPPHIVERVLNHISGAQGGLVAVYQRYEYLEERKRAIEAWGNYVEALIVDRPMADNVRPLRA